MFRNVARNSISAAVTAIAVLMLLTIQPISAQNDQLPGTATSLHENQDAPPVLAVDQTVLYFHKIIGGPNPPSQSLTISNAGGFTYQWSATKTNDWLTMSAASGTSPSTVNVGVTLDSETSQHLLDTITITSTEAINAPKSVVVVVSVDHGEPFDWGDADCSGGVDIDDVVYVITYIFAGGSPPGDTDNNGIQDCP